MRVIIPAQPALSRIATIIPAFVGFLCWGDDTARDLRGDCLPPGSAILEDQAGSGSGMAPVVENEVAVPVCR